MQNPREAGRRGKSGSWNISGRAESEEGGFSDTLNQFSNLENNICCYFFTNREETNV